MLTSTLAYIFFAGWLLVGGVFVYFFIPETRGKTLEEMDAAFGSHTSQEDLDELEAVQREVGLLALLDNDDQDWSGGQDIKEKEKGDCVELSGP